MLKIKVKTHEGIDLFFKEEKIRFFDATIDGIRYAWENKLDNIRVAEFEVVADDIITSIDIAEDDWSESLHLALYYFEDIQAYEKCGELQKLISDIYDD